MEKIVEGILTSADMVIDLETSLRSPSLLHNPIAFRGQIHEDRPCEVYAVISCNPFVIQIYAVSLRIFDEGTTN